MDRSGLHRYKRVFSATHRFLFFISPSAFPPSFIPLSVSLLHSHLPPSFPPYLQGTIPCCLYERLLFKTLRSDLVPTEAIPLAALCIYHGSPILSRLLTLQFSLLPPPPVFPLLLSLCETHISHLSCFLLLPSFSNLARLSFIVCLFFQIEFVLSALVLPTL